MQAHARFAVAFTGRERQRQGPRKQAATPLHHHTHALTGGSARALAAHAPHSRTSAPARHRPSKWQSFCPALDQCTCFLHPPGIPIRVERGDVLACMHIRRRMLHHASQRSRRCSRLPGRSVRVNAMVAHDQTSAGGAMRARVHVRLLRGSRTCKPCQPWVIPWLISLNISALDSLPHSSPSPVLASCPPSQPLLVRVEVRGRASAARPLHGMGGSLGEHSFPSGAASVPAAGSSLTKASSS